MVERGTSAGMDSPSNFLRDTPSLALTDFTESDTESTSSPSSQRELLSLCHSPNNQEPEEIGVVLMGKTGAGKSYLGNYLLQKERFQPSSSIRSCTSECQTGERLLNGLTKLKVIDTPGLFDTDITVSENINKILSLFECLQCVDIFLLVVRVDIKLGKDEMEALQWLKDHFGENLNDFSVIILNNHGYKPKNKETLIGEAPEILRTIIADCDNRCVLLQYNEISVVDDNKDIDAILEIINTTVRKNNGRRYTYNMHGDAKMKYDEKVKRLEEQSKKREKELEEQLENMQKENDELQKYKQLAKEKEHFSSKVNLLLSLIPSEKQEEAKHIIKDKGDVTGQFNEKAGKQAEQNISILGIAGKVRGKISDNDEATIRYNWKFLIDNIKDHIQTLMEHLFQKEVFDYEDMEKIKKTIKNEDSRAGACMLLKTVMQSGPGAYQRFIECLEETGFSGVVDKLQVKRSTASVSDSSSIQHSPELPNSPSTPQNSESNEEPSIQTPLQQSDMTQYTIHQSFDQNFQNRQPIPLSSSTRHPIILSVPISQLPHASPYQQRPAVTPVTPKQPSNTPTPHTSLYKRRPDKDLPKGYSGYERIRATSIDPLHGRSVTEPDEFGNHCKTVAVSSAQDLNGNKSLIETAEMEHQSVDQPNRWGTEDPHTTKQTMASSTTQDLKEIRIVLVGKTGVGKSALGNSLLRYEAFKSSISGSSVTSICKCGTRTLEDGSRLLIVDTPGFFDTRKTYTESVKAAIHSILLTSPGPHVYVFVVSIGRFTNEEFDTITTLKDIFGERLMNFVIILFTRKDMLIDDDITLDEYIESCPENLKSIISECQGRCVAINNRAHPVNLEKDVEDILKVVRETIQSNSGNHYTVDMYEAAEVPEERKRGNLKKKLKN